MCCHTFVICAYKESEYLEECIKSIIAQDSIISRKSEVILYTSTPNNYIKKMIDQYEIPFFTKKGGNIGRDWNNALEFVKTKYATIVHQDDIYLPNYGEIIITNFKKSDDTLLVFSDYGEVDNNSHIRPRNISLKIKTFVLKLMNLFPRWKFYQRRIFAFGNFISAPTVSYNLELLEDFKFDETLKMALDWDAWERIMKLSGIIRYVKSIEMFHRIHGKSETTVNTTSGQREQEELMMFRRYWPLFISNLLMKFYVKNQKFNN
jgi:glycosyltransferase involved in cell wall biosynthesis